MALNFGLIGIPIAIIQDSNTKNNNSIVSLHTNEDKAEHAYDIGQTFDTLHLTSGKFQVIPNKKQERSTVLTIGSSGSGKSTFIYNWLKEYKKIFKKNDIFLISSLEKDNSIDKIKPKRIILDDAFIDEKQDINNYKDCVVIFDDVEALNKIMKYKVYELMNLLLTTGRHSNTSVLIAVHNPTNGHESKIMLIECQLIVVFPNDMSRRLKYMLENYCGLDTQQITKLKKLKSRWISIYKRYPKTIIGEVDIIPIDNL
jgi:hypothetical protein